MPGSGGTDGKDADEFRVLIRMLSEPGKHQSINEIVVINQKCRYSFITKLSAASKRGKIICKNTNNYEGIK